MAIVKNQDIPTDHIEDQLDPPIPFIDSYRRVLGEALVFPKFEAGTGLVADSKKDSRPSTRETGAVPRSDAQREWRDVFKGCLECWRGQYETDAELNECHSAGSKHYVKPWNYVPGAQHTYFHQWMKACLDWEKANPDESFAQCEDLLPEPASFDFCPGDTITFEVPNGNEPFIAGVDCGAIAAELQWEAPADAGECEDGVKVWFEDYDGRKGCAYGTEMSAEDCCCVEPPGLGLEYASLVIACNESMEIAVSEGLAGCAPYSWEVVGGGTIEGAGSAVTYAAPASNAGCLSNPVITCRDHCGTEVELRLAVNCYDGVDEAVWWNRRLHCPGNHPQGGPCHYVGDQGLWMEMHTICSEILRCDGVKLCGHYWDGMAREDCTCSGAASTSYGCNPNDDECCEGCLSEWPGGCAGVVEACGDETVVDKRTENMKSQGCCPINPATGLPF